MKKFIAFVCLLGFTTVANAQTTESNAASKETVGKSKIVEASCGECKFGMKEPGCNLAVRIDGVPYFVEGAKLDGFGDAHGKDGMCNAIRKAEVIGEVRDGKFVAQSFKLLPVEEAKQ